MSLFATYIAQALVLKAKGTDQMVCPGNWEQLSHDEQINLVTTDETKGLLHCYCDKLSFADRTTVRLHNMFAVCIIVVLTVVFLMNAGWILQELL